MRSKSFRMLLVTAFAGGIIGAGAAPASAQNPCYEHHPTEQPIEWTICMWYFLTK